MSKLDGKVILVTGAHGFIGSHLVARLSEFAGARLLLLSRHDRQSIRPNLVWFKGELAQLTAEYWRAHGVSQIDYVFHLGGFIPKTSSDTNQIDQVVDGNLLGTRALLKSLPGKPARVVFSSTVDVYAPPEAGQVLNETSTVSPQGLYGASKLFCESLVSAWEKERGSNYSILRYGHIYGPGEEQYGKLIPVSIRNLLTNQAAVVHGDGSALRDYLYVGDAVEAAIRAAMVEGNLGPINIVRGESVSLKEIVQLLIHLVGSNKEIDFLSDKPNGNSLRFDNGLMMESLGNWRKTDLEEGLRAEVEAFRRAAHER